MEPQVATGTPWAFHAKTVGQPLENTSARLVSAPLKERLSRHGGETLILSY
jgi:hypothetical protein